MNQRQQKLFDKTIDGLKLHFPDLDVYDVQATERGLIIRHSRGETHVNPSLPDRKEAKKGFV